MASGYSKQGKIPLDLRNTAYTMYFAQGKTSEELKQWLMKEHNIDIAANSISKILKKEKEKREAISNDVIKNDLKLSNEDGFKLIDQVIAFTHNEFFTHWKNIPDEDKDPKILLKLLEIGHKYLETRLKANGAIKEEEEISNDDLLKKVHQMTEDHKEKS